MRDYRWMWASGCGPTDHAVAYITQRLCGRGGDWSMSVCVWVRGDVMVWCWDRTVLRKA
jgi:hypothetical protein